MKRPGFTLVELLVVIAIIAILAAMLMPAMNAVFRKAEVSQAQTDIRSIEAAVRAFYSDYGKFPHGNGNANDYSYGGLGGYSLNSELMNVLRSVNGPGNVNFTNNYRRTVYLEVPQDSLSTNNFVDPWGQQYEITIDTGYDNRCNDMKGGYSVATNRIVAVWSRGRDQKAPSQDPATTDDLKSW